LAEELNREYSVLKSSLGESMNAPPIMGSCRKKTECQLGLEDMPLPARETAQAEQHLQNYDPPGAIMQGFASV
jgi:hypothetical protein